MERKLPLINLVGTDFIVDVEKMELREKANPNNIIPFEKMKDTSDAYAFEYSPLTKNIPSGLSQHYIMVNIPEFVKLDPEGMANKYKVPDISGKTDFDLMVDQEAFNKRFNKGILPTIDIAGQLFYVDLRMDKLRPHDDFISNGIVFDDIDHYFSEGVNAYIIPYHPEKHEFQELALDTITELPKDLIAVQIPLQRELDPIGWNRAGGWPIKDGLKQIGLKSHFKAEIIPWELTALTSIIEDNGKKQKKEAKISRSETVPIPRKPSKGKGRKM